MVWGVSLALGGNTAVAATASKRKRAPRSTFERGGELRRGVRNCRVCIANSIS